MNLKDVLAKCIPTLFKKDLIDTVYNTNKELEEVNLKVYKEAVSNFGNWTFTSSEMKIKIALFNSNVKNRKGNIVSTIYDRLTNLKKILDRLTPYLEKNFQDTTSSSALSYKKGQYLQLVDYIKFYLEYSRNFLNYLIIAETAKFDSGNSIDKALTPIQRRQVEDNFVTFCQLTEIFSQDESSVLAKLDKVPDRIVVPDSMDIVESSYGKSELDPLSFNFISTTFNPFYAIQVRLALNAHMKYEKSLEERELLKLKLLSFQRRNDPSLAKQIAILEDRINKLNYQIAKEEELYG